MNAPLAMEAQCAALCCERRDLCAAYIFYTTQDFSPLGHNGNCTSGGPCCWLKSGSVAPAHLWQNDPVCFSGVVQLQNTLA